MSIRNSEDDYDIESNEYVAVSIVFTNKPMSIPIIIRPVPGVTNKPIINNTNLFIVVSILYPIISILDIYFVINDESCVHQTIGLFFNIKLYHYFILDSVYGICLITFLIIILCAIDFDIDNVVVYKTFYLFSLVRCILGLILTSVGTYIFWGLMDTNRCNHPVYYYTYVSLIIRYIFGIMIVKQK